MKKNIAFSVILILAVVVTYLLVGQKSPHTHGPIIYPDTTITSGNIMVSIDADSFMYKVLRKVKQKGENGFDSAYEARFMSWKDSTGTLHSDSVPHSHRNGLLWYKVLTPMIIHDDNRDYFPALHHYK